LRSADRIARVHAVPFPPSEGRLVSPVLDTALIPTRDRQEVVRQAVWDSLVKVDIAHHLPSPDLAVRIGLESVGHIGVCSARATALTIRRTPRLAREDEEPAVFLGLQVSGSSLVVQHDRQALLGPGDFALYDTTTPYTLVFEEGVDQHFLRFPRSALALPERSLRDVTAVTLGTGNPLAGLASTYFSQLAVSEGLRSGRHAEGVALPSVELLRAVVTAQLGDSALGRVPMEATLDLRIREYLRAHLAEHDLSAARIAAAHGISVRHLYTVLARSGISLGEWIRTHRLAECKRELAAPESRFRTVAAIGRRWGFPDATHFSRVFKQAYGLSPRTWRDQHRPRPLS
jgi:AraC-like DNA-binding protein